MAGFRSSAAAAVSVGAAGCSSLAVAVADVADVVSAAGVAVAASDAAVEVSDVCDVSSAPASDCSASTLLRRSSLAAVGELAELLADGPSRVGLDLRLRLREASFLEVVAADSASINMSESSSTDAIVQRANT